MSEGPRWGGLALALLLLGGCTASGHGEAGAHDGSVDLDWVAFFPQTQHHCGPAALATVLIASGVEADPEALAREVYVPALEGSLQPELQAATRRHGRMAYTLAPTLTALRAELDAGTPVLVLQNFGLPRAPSWHYGVVVGYDRHGERMLLRTGTTRRDAVAVARFDATWRRADRWAFVATAPAQIPVTATAQDWLGAAGELAATAGPAAATAAYRAAVQRWPTEPVAWIALGNERLEAGDAADAEMAYQSALVVRPTAVAARNNLALLLARRGCGTSARVEIERAERDAMGTPLAAEIADSAQQIRALTQTPAGQQHCPKTELPP